MSKTIFIVVEGIDRSGKSTLICRIEKELKLRGIYVEAIRYPNRQNMTGSLIDRILRQKEKISKEAMHLLFSANRWEDAEKVKAFLEGENEEENNSEINGMLGKYRVLLCDRYILSGVAYASADNISQEKVVLYDEGLAVPDLTLFIDQPPSITQKRIGFGEELFENTEFQWKVYDSMKANLSRYRNEIITGDTPSAVFELAMNHIMRLISSKDKK